MTKQLSYCGYRCDLCAARSDDPEVRQKLVDGWRKYFGHQMYTAENVKCVGCRNEGPHADTGCPVRPCAIEKGVETCAHCDEFPCDKLRPLLGERAHYQKHFADVPEEDYSLCIRMFESVDNLRPILKELGKE